MPKPFDLLPKEFPPHPPKISDLLKKGNPLREVISDARELIRTGREEIGEVASSLRVGERPTPRAGGGVSDTETLEYQLDHLLDEINLLETHLSERGRIADKVCDCIEKSARRVKAYAQETIPIASRQGKETKIFSELASWAREMQEIGGEAAVASGKYDERYLQESGTASKFRKELQRIKSEECEECPRLEDLKTFLEQRRRSK